VFESEFLKTLLLVKSLLLFIIHGDPQEYNEFLPFPVLRDKFRIFLFLP
jgi:hypothetical protein